MQKTLVLLLSCLKLRPCGSGTLIVDILIRWRNMHHCSKAPILTAFSLFRARNEPSWSAFCPDHEYMTTISIFRCVLGEDSSHFYKRVSSSVCLSHPKYQREYQLIEVEKNLNSQVFSSSFNRSIIMRTHRWPYAISYGPCSMIGASYFVF